MKPIYWQLAITIIVIAYVANWSQITDVGGDEKIYIISAALLDADININAEHPPLIKHFYNLLLTPEYKAEIVDDPSLRTSLLWIPGQYANEHQKILLYQGTRYIRLVNGFLITAFLLFVWWRSKNFMLFLSLLSLLAMSDQLFSALLDGWLFVGSVGGYYLLSVGNPVGWVFALVLGPLAKINGFVLSLFSLFKWPKSAIEFGGAMALLAFTVLVFWGVQSVSYGATHFWMQFGGNNAVNYPDWPGTTAFFNLRYLTPFLGIALVKYCGKEGD